ncbi:MAG: hypothetical protein ACTIA3_00925 [Corynebacterium casei]|uniref:hypothetical protein n=1 Tax=Corynebacterium casei TaxID=160386 RepID=UPI0009C544DA|nr:hypothetical protein [Corynebacterium casei]MDN5903016.1 hypothetical protein [Corynebacterium casei]MDN6131535.1 hypothetical protein [Corynebacterium casei]MDN6155291.1 hypothetical protein [Corynebacterium casei]MDN6673997.1 hypothetical protein [Corynebacterium casei]SLM88778.1 hypothetical protein CZ765_04425 [Corynebacterium casei]
MDKDYRPPRRRPRTNARETAWQQTVHNQSVGNRDRRSEAAQAVPARVVRRHPPHIYRRRRAAAIGIFVFMLLLIIFLAGACGPGPTQTLQGDQLGPEPEESAQQYQTRAATSVVDARNDTYALVTFDGAVDAETAAQAVEGAQRVSSVITQEAFLPVEIPEPIEGETRADVFSRAVGDEELNSVIVYENGDMLEEISHREGVFAVEAAPDDAAWGSFGIRPVMDLEITQ